MKLEERLNEELNKKDEEIAGLKDKIVQLERRLESSESGWCMARDDDREDTTNYPIPRLEITWTPSKEFGWRIYRTEYRMIYKHLSGPVVIMPIAFTRHNSGSGSNPFELSYARPEQPYLPDMPWRMGCEAVHDAHQLGLPLYAVTPSGHLRIDGHPHYEIQIRMGKEARTRPKDESAG